MVDSTDPNDRSNDLNYRVRGEFRVHMLNENGRNKAAELARHFTLLLDILENLCGVNGREMSIVRTKLEEASFFAKKAMAGLAENRQ